MQFVHGLPGAGYVQSNICGTALEERGIEMVLQVPGGIGGHCVRGVWKGDGGKGERVRVHFSLDGWWWGVTRREQAQAASGHQGGLLRSSPHGIPTSKSTKSSLLRPLILLSLLGRTPLAKFDQVLSSKYTLNQHSSRYSATQSPAKHLR